MGACKIPRKEVGVVGEIVGVRLLVECATRDVHRSSVLGATDNKTGSAIGRIDPRRGAANGPPKIVPLAPPLLTLRRVVRSAISSVSLHRMVNMEDNDFRLEVSSPVRNFRLLAIYGRSRRCSWCKRVISCSLNWNQRLASRREYRLFRNLFFLFLSNVS